MMNTKQEASSSSATTDNTRVEVHYLTTDPTKYWNECQELNGHKYEDIDADTWHTAHELPVDTGHIRVVCISDTHYRLDKVAVTIPDGDILIHAGDFTMKGSVEEIKIHGYNIYGSPWQPEFFEWAYNLPRGRPCLEVWNQIPDDTDILITHGPPVGHGDTLENGERTGCVELLTTIERRVRPMYHVFGHIHEGYGISTNGTTTFINPSTCTRRYKPTNPPIVFDLPKRH